MTAYGTTIAIWEKANARFLFEGISTPNARTSSIIRNLHPLLPSIAEGHPRGALFVQYDDFSRYDMMSVAFGKKKSDIDGIKLIPDAFFLDSHGYENLRQAAKNKCLPVWHDRSATVFWRGSATTRDISSKGEAVVNLEQIPRVELCLILRELPETDAAIIGPWGFKFDPAYAVEWFKREGIFQAPIPPLEQARYKYLIDIDGVANAWGFFEKLLLGSCILKIESDFKQWFYDQIMPWEHYVPVAKDFSDLRSKIDWCRENPDEAAAIGARGQSFAFSHDFVAAQEMLIHAARSCFIPF